MLGSTPAPGLPGATMAETVNRSAVPPERSLVIVTNAGSGSKNDHEQRQVIEGVLRQAGCRHRFVLVDKAKHLPRIAAEAVQAACAEKAVVVAAGGDGTISAVVQAVLGRGCAMGVLPKGTFNYFSRTHGIPDDLAAATRLLVDGRASPVQIGLVNGKVFVVNASLGLHRHALENRELWTKQYGRHRIVAMLSGLATLLRGHGNLHIRVDCGDRVLDVETPMLFVGNNRLQLQSLGLAEASAPDAGRLAAIVVRPVGKFAMLWLTLRGAAGRLGTAADITALSVERMTISGSPRHRARRFKVAVDGEPTKLRAPLVFEVAAERVMLVMPPGADATAPA